MLPEALVPNKKYYENLRYLSFSRDDIRNIIRSFSKKEILLMATHAFYAGKCNFHWDSYPGEVLQSINIQVNSQVMTENKNSCLADLDLAYGELLEDLETRLILFSLNSKTKNWNKNVCTAYNYWENLKESLTWNSAFDFLISAPSIEIKNRYTQKQTEVVHNITSVPTYKPTERLYGETVKELYRYFNPVKYTWVTVGSIDNKDGTEQLIIFTENPTYVKIRCGIDNTLQVWGQIMVSDFEWNGVQHMTSVKADIITVL